MSKIYLQQLLKSIESQLNSPLIAHARKPMGYLSCHNSHLGLRFYLVSYAKGNQNDSRVCSPLGGLNNHVRRLIHQRIRYEQRKRLRKNMKIINKALSQYQDCDVQAILETLPEAYLKGYAADCESFRSNLKEAFYPTNQYPSDVMHRTSDGVFVKSKSELIIYEMLTANKVPFRYEERLILFDGRGEKVFRYPDFTIHFPDGRQLFWEHIGLLQDTAYQTRFLNSLPLYHLNNIKPFDNLYFSFDDPDGGLDMATISRIITQNILPFI